MANLGLQSVRANVTSSVKRMTGPQRITLGLAFAATVGAMFAVSHLTGGTPMSTLYTNLDSAAAAAVVAQLDAQAIPYELLDGGKVIQIPAAQVAKVRLDLSAQGLPSSGAGWSILDNQGITTSEFDQRVGYQRAMEGELAKTIKAIDGVGDANVHLVIPKDDLFSGDTVKASASVLVVTKGTQSISPTQVQAIVNLVSSSIQGMTPDQVSVTDQSGHILAAPGDTKAAVGLEGDSQLRAQRSFEDGVETDLESLLASVVGPGLAQVDVTADLDFDAVKTTSESYEPAKTADGAQSVLNETSRSEIYRDGAAAAETGVLGIETPTTQPTTSTTTGTGTGGSATNSTTTDPKAKYTLAERNANYAMNKVVTNAEQAPGAVKKLSVAVLLDETAIDASRLPEIQQLVTAAAGIDTNRGDTLAVSLLPINQAVKANIDAANAPADTGGSGLDIIGLIRTIGTVIVALVVIFFGLQFLRKGAGGRKVIDSINLSELETATPALGAGAVNDAEPIEPPETRLQTLIANQPEEVAGVLRSWLSEAEPETV